MMDLPHIIQFHAGRGIRNRKMLSFLFLFLSNDVIFFKSFVPFKLSTADDIFSR